ncbi:sulfite oxidase heme-binding subunit YedZ [Amphritea pacifica]|uniref:Protein-methionine-sulfoxide reductase heme-binding subunit MsrQ n=2 Tax=Amphritea pacifica TaxID=2811233 RepID=A0ABS2WDK4_9GAMM|nr:protein-methionine-sulfoxide reductase heme-binding subunit MsrQ [Amphritea pacifica]MBN0989696.1 sulfoxide reductase heme-binding subunit YedZ [Amphritea pacifica]MBN1008968.1 sulfoxide reductase heme-binding subunit YedZ [Amphritea pacifica]
MVSVAPMRLFRWWLFFLLLLLPLGRLVEGLLTNDLGADPAKYIVKELGFWALCWLWLTLAVTPLRKFFGWRWLMVYRRMFGLYAFFYAVLHLLAFATFLLGWRWDMLMTELTKRPYIVMGSLALLLLLPLAVTSTQKMQRRLGRRWKKLHMLIYPASLLVLLHFVWQIRSDFFQQLIFAILLAILLGYRLYLKRRS